jgi:hypothetical protein
MGAAVLAASMLTVIVFTGVLGFALVRYSMHSARNTNRLSALLPPVRTRPEFARSRSHAPQHCSSKQHGRKFGP